MGAFHKELVIKEASEKLWTEFLENQLSDSAEDLAQEFMADYLEGMVPQEVLDLYEIYDTYLKDNVVNMIRKAQNELILEISVKTLLIALKEFGYDTRLTEKEEPCQDDSGKEPQRLGLA